MMDFDGMLLAASAGFVGGAMNALAGGGTFATMPALIALGLPSTIANATSNVALQPGAMTAVWGFRNQLEPVGGIRLRTLSTISFIGGLIGSLLLVFTPTTTFDIIIPWLLLIAFFAIAFGQTASTWLNQHVSIGPTTLKGAQALLGIYGGYFGGGLGIMTTATYGLLAGIPPHRLMATRILMLGITNLAAALVFIGYAKVHWMACFPMLAGALIGGWFGATFGKGLPARAIRFWTLFITLATTIIFFVRAYG